MEMALGGNEALLGLLKAYLAEHYVPGLGTGEISQGFGDEEKGGRTLTWEEAEDLGTLVDGAGETFSQRLMRLVDESGMTDAEVYRRAGIDRRHYSKIRSDIHYHPRKSTVIALALALRLSSGEAQELLALAEYALSPGSRSDLIVRFFLERRIYDIDLLNETLDAHGEEPLLPASGTG